MTSVGARFPSTETNIFNLRDAAGGLPFHTIQTNAVEFLGVAPTALEIPLALAPSASALG
jgi:hypothetical protein